jgi:5-(carboxyamino)imidazole ribonucleotide synthase
MFNISFSATDKSSPRLGVYGDGQLARLFVLTAQSWGISPVVFTLDAAHSPCRSLGVEWIEGKSWDDAEAFSRFTSLASVIVLENEFVPPFFLQEAEKAGIHFLPDAKSYSALSDKLKQVQLAEKEGLRVPEYQVLHNADENAPLTPPLMLKTLRGGYDGYGNFSYTRRDQWPQAVAFINKGGPCLAQEWISFDKEVALLVALEHDQNESIVFPAAETLQEDRICHFVISPPRISLSLQKNLAEAARKIMTSLQAQGGVGLFAIEFLLQGEEIIFNEIAPRPHNSAHFTIEGCTLSQYQALLQLALRLPLGKPHLTAPAVGMLNLLGNTQSTEPVFSGDSEFFTKGHLHLYHKFQSRPGRKMGHYTLCGDDQEKILHTLAQRKKGYRL